MLLQENNYFKRKLFKFQEVLKTAEASILHLSVDFGTVDTDLEKSRTDNEFLRMGHLHFLLVKSDASSSSNRRRIEYSVTAELDMKTAGIITLFRKRTH